MLFNFLSVGEFFKNDVAVATIIAAIITAVGGIIGVIIGIKAKKNKRDNRHIIEIPKLDSHEEDGEPTVTFFNGSDLMDAEIRELEEDTAESELIDIYDGDFTDQEDVLFEDISDSQVEEEDEDLMSLPLNSEEYMTELGARIHMNKQDNKTDVSITRNNAKEEK